MATIPLPENAELNPDGFYVVPDNPAVYNASGYVALKYKRQQRVMVTCGERQYIFSMRANISMAWVHPEDIPCAFAVKGGCCGNKRPGIIIYANENDTRQWSNGGGR